MGWENSWIWVNPNDLNFSQAYILENNYAELMNSGKWNWDKPLNVMEVNGQHVSLDNRRLHAAQTAGLKEVPIEKVTSDQVIQGDGTYGKNPSKKLNSAPQGCGLPKVQLPETGTKVKPQIVPNPKKSGGKIGRC